MTRNFLTVARPTPADAPVITTISGARFGEQFFLALLRFRGLGAVLLDRKVRFSFVRLRSFHRTESKDSVHLRVDHSRRAQAPMVPGPSVSGPKRFRVHRMEPRERERHRQAADLGERARASQSNALQHDERVAV
jgi:hypothetical protein